MLKLTDIGKLYDNKARGIHFQSDIEGNLILRIAQYAKMLKTSYLFCTKYLLGTRGYQSRSVCHKTWIANNAP